MGRMEELIKKLWQSTQEKRVCRLVLQGEPLPRVIHPYGACKTSGGKIVLVGRQIGGYSSKGGDVGYRNLLFTKIQEVEIMEERFLLPDDFNPTDAQYKEWIFHIKQ